MLDQRSYDAQPERVFAALINELDGLAAKVEHVEGFGTMVIFRTAGQAGRDHRRFSARVAPARTGTLLRISGLADESGAEPDTHRPTPELMPGLLDAVQDRLDRGPQARP